MTVAAFFAYARERHSTHLRRAAGLPRAQWTSDPILQQYRFCNVYRELDRTTVWFRENVRDRLKTAPEVLLATVLFRWFNRIQTGEAIFSQTQMRLSPPGAEAETPWDSWLSYHWEPHEFVDNVRRAIRSYCGSGPYVTGSYIIKTPDGKDKLDGVLWCIEQFMKSSVDNINWIHMAHSCLREGNQPSLERMWEWLCQFPYMGPFMAYEVVTDLRHTALLDRAPDIMTWANPGPGARRGLNRIHGRPLEHATPRAQLIAEMREILLRSRDVSHWPQPTETGGITVWVDHAIDGILVDMPEFEKKWPAWEMREVEHTLCEFDKYERARTGAGRPRQVFR